MGKVVILFISISINHIDPNQLQYCTKEQKLRYEASAIALGILASLGQAFCEVGERFLSGEKARTFKYHNQKLQPYTDRLCDVVRYNLDVPNQSNRAVLSLVHLCFFYSLYLTYKTTSHIKNKLFKPLPKEVVVIPNPPNQPVSYS